MEPLSSRAQARELLVAPCELDSVTEVRDGVVSGTLS